MNIFTLQYVFYFCSIFPTFAEWRDGMEILCLSILTYCEYDNLKIKWAMDFCFGVYLHLSVEKFTIENWTAKI